MARVVLMNHGIGLQSSNRGLKNTESKTAGRHVGAAPYGNIVKFQRKIIEGLKVK